MYVSIDTSHTSAPHPVCHHNYNHAPLHDLHSSAPALTLSEGRSIESSSVSNERNANRATDPSTLALSQTPESPSSAMPCTAPFRPSARTYSSGKLDAVGGSSAGLGVCVVNYRAPASETHPTEALRKRHGGDSSEAVRHRCVSRGVDYL